MKAKTIIIFVTIVACTFSIFSISKDRYILADSLAYCCENLVCDGNDCSGPSSMHHEWYNDCDEVTLTCKDCVDAWRYWRLCDQTSVEYTYCMENGIKYSSWCGYEYPLTIGISGPGSIAPGVTGHFAASTYGGCPDKFPVHYKWFILYPCIELQNNQESLDEVIDAFPCDEWNVVGSDSPNLSRSDTKSYYVKCEAWNNFDAFPLVNPAVSNIIHVVVSDL